jgi:biotin synthase-like enzyme
MSGSKIFLLIVGANTNTVTKGSCQYCDYRTQYGICAKKLIPMDTRSFIQYECEKAAKDGLKIIVLYNYANVDRSKCPEAVRYRGEHLAAYHLDYSGYAPRKVWNYQSIKNAIEKAKQ